jgi:hypothetical protein
MARKWEYSRGQLALTVRPQRQRGIATHWCIATLVGRSGEKYDDRVQGRWRKIMFWDEARPHVTKRSTFFQWNIGTEAEAISIAQETARKLGLPFVRNVEHGDRVRTVEAAVLEELSKL